MWKIIFAVIQINCVYGQLSFLPGIDTMILNNRIKQIDEINVTMGVNNLKDSVLSRSYSFDADGKLLLVKSFSIIANGYCTVLYKYDSCGSVIGADTTGFFCRTRSEGPEDTIYSKTTSEFLLIKGKKVLISETTESEYPDGVKTTTSLNYEYGTNNKVSKQISRHFVNAELRHEVSSLFYYSDLNLISRISFTSSFDGDSERFFVYYFW